MISASHEDRATDVCFLLPQLMVALACWKVKPIVECFTAQSESEQFILYYWPANTCLFSTQSPELVLSGPPTALGESCARSGCLR